jgi:hypothetical protein
MNTAYALSQIVFGAMCLIFARQSLDVLGRWPAVSLSLVASAAWLIFGFAFIEYWEPKFTVAVFAALVIAAALAA